MVALELGNAWWNPLPLQMWGHLNLRETLVVGPTPIASISLHGASGATCLDTCSGAFTAGQGALVRNWAYIGEEWNATRAREIQGWQTAPADLGWPPAVALTKGPTGAFRAAARPSGSSIVRRIAVARTINGSTFDFGVNFSGQLELHCSSNNNMTLEITYGELLFQNGTVNWLTAAAGQIHKPNECGFSGRLEVSFFKPFGSLSKLLKRQFDVVHCVEGMVFHNHFVTHSFRYVTIVGGLVEASQVWGLQMQCSTLVAGGTSQLETSEPLLNKIIDMSMRSIISNTPGMGVGLQTDCPGRERFGYGGDVVASAEAVFMGFPSATTFYKAAAQRFLDVMALRNDGACDETSPNVGIADGSMGQGSGSPIWQSVLVCLAELLTRVGGSRAVSKEHYQGLLGNLAFFEGVAHAHGGILPMGLGDWSSPSDPSICVNFSSTTWWLRDILAAAEVAQMQGDSMNEARLRARAEELQETIVGRFLDRSTGCFCSCNNQYTVSLALDTPGLVSPAHAAQLRSRLMNLTQSRTFASSGIFGVSTVLRQLTQAQQQLRAFELVSSTDYPSFGFTIANGATSLWEVWNVDTSTYSQNHAMFAGGLAWIWQGLCGLRPLAGPGYYGWSPYPPETKNFTCKGKHRGIIFRAEQTCFTSSKCSLAVEIELPPGIVARVSAPPGYPQFVRNITSAGFSDVWELN